MDVRPVLIIQCGAKKLEHRATVRDLYLGPFWSTYRARRKEQDGATGDHSVLAVFVLSAEHGLVPEGQEIAPYDARIITRRNGRNIEKGCRFVPADELSLKVKRQARKLDLSKRVVFFVGGQDYAIVLNLAGVSFESLSDGGLLAKRSALNRFLKEHPSIQNGNPLEEALARIGGWALV